MNNLRGKATVGFIYCKSFVLAHHHHHHIRFYVCFTCRHALDGFQKIDFQANLTLARSLLTLLSERKKRKKEEKERRERKKEEKERKKRKKERRERKKRKKKEEKEERRKRRKKRKKKEEKEERRERKSCSSPPPKKFRVLKTTQLICLQYISQISFTC